MMSGSVRADSTTKATGEGIGRIRRVREDSVQLFDFEVLRGDEVMSSETSVALESSRNAWPRIVRIAQGLELPGCSIRVREHAGDTVILIGATAARSFPEREFHA